MSLLDGLRRLLSPARGEDGPAAGRGPDSDPARKRRRGKRGGRGRNRGDASRREGAHATTTTATDSPSRAGRPAPARDRGGDRRDRRDDRRRDRGGRDRRDGRRRRNLDAPLPEDVAFRPAAEGGDETILPGRRRPPSGPRTTRRVWVGGLRNLPVLGGGDAANDAEAEDAEDERETLAPAEARAPLADGEDARDGDDGDGEEQPKRRRRGRRGGRGRNRSRAEAEEGDIAGGNGAAPDGDAADAAFAEADADGARDGAGEDEAAPAFGLEAFDPADAPEAFRALGVSDRSLAAVAAMGFTEPTPVQERAIPVLLTGRDVVGIAQTGTGKTLAFGIPMTERLDPARAEAQALVLTPTRELAQQVLAVLADLGRPYGLRTVGLLGGHALEGDFRALDGRPHVVVGTPGRIKDHLQRRTLSLHAVRYAVLDEADQMLDIGFLPDITSILGRTPRSRQTALFSATMPHNVMRLVRRYMDRPETIAVAPELATVESVEHVYFEVAERDKVRGLRELIDRELRGRTLVFSRTKRGVDRLAERLEGLGVNVGALHGDMEQRRRDRVVRRFREGELDLLIATNVAARGLDIPEITHVVNYDAADNAEEYVHRTGRTGRAGREGKAISFVSEIDIDRFDVLRETFGDRLARDRLDLYA